MTAYELMIKTNHYLIKDGILTENQKRSIAKQLLSAKSTPEQAQKFYKGVRFPNNIDAEGRQMYPFYYIPPYNNGKKLKTIFDQTPKTHILSSNMYELEIIRLLNLLAPYEPVVKDMTQQTLMRLKTTCFGYHDDGLGECFDSSVIVLRFLAAVALNEEKWINSRIQNYNKHVNDKKRQCSIKWYFWLCLSELPFETAKLEILKYEDEIMPWLTNKSMVMNSDHDKTVHPVIICVLRNMMCRFSEYEHIKSRQPYISEKDGRLHFDINY